jgi:DNA-binding response OmpR family regulator
MSFSQRILLVQHQPHFTTLVESAFLAKGTYLIQRETYNPRIVRAALHFQPNLIVLDPPPDGLRLEEIARTIQENAFLNEVPVICLTTLAADGKIGSIGFFGGYTFVADPCQLGDLVAGITEILKDQPPFGAAA